MARIYWCPLGNHYVVTSDEDPLLVNCPDHPESVLMLVGWSEEREDLLKPPEFEIVSEGGE